MFNPKLNAKIHGVMAFTLWFGVLAFTLLYVYLLDRRYRLAALEEDREERELERRSPSASAPVPRGPTDGPSERGRHAMRFAEYVIAGWVAHRRRARRVLAAARPRTSARAVAAEASVDRRPRVDHRATADRVDRRGAALHRRDRRLRRRRGRDHRARPSCCPRTSSTSAPSPRRCTTAPSEGTTGSASPARSCRGRSCDATARGVRFE